MNKVIRIPCSRALHCEAEFWKKIQKFQQEYPEFDMDIAITVVCKDGACTG